jgi:hypothetical protein
MMRLIMISDTHGRPDRLQRRKTVSQSSSELNRIALDYLRRLRAEGLKGAKVEVLKPYEKRSDNAGTSMKIEGGTDATT